MEKFWSADEFAQVNFNDNRLNKRLGIICQSFAESPTSPINHACADWAETKAAYRFFSNDKVDYKEIVKNHNKATLARCGNDPITLAIQDTTYLTYSNHPKTKDLCVLTKFTGDNNVKFTTKGLIMHSTLAVSTDGLVAGILDQKIYARADDLKDHTINNSKLPIKDKDSYRWITSLENTVAGFNDPGSVVTVCDRECDIYEFFHRASQLKTHLLVRAKYNRTVNKKTVFSETTGEKLWSLLKRQDCMGTINVAVPSKENKPGRTAVCQVRFSSFELNPAHNIVKYIDKDKPNLSMYAICVSEINSSNESDPIEWMLLTDLPITTIEQALEKIAWYCLRWRIEVWHKVLKSGMCVEDCRLNTATRLIRYLSVMSIVAWRIFWLTLTARVSPDTPCSIFLKENEWKILQRKFSKENPNSDTIPTIRQVVTWIAQLGGFLARKNDKDPGNTHIWRGLKYFNAMLDGVSYAKD